MSLPVGISLQPISRSLVHTTNATTTFYGDEGQPFTSEPGFYAGWVNHEIGHTWAQPHGVPTMDVG